MFYFYYKTGLYGQCHFRHEIITYFIGTCVSEIYDDRNAPDSHI